MKSRTSVLMSFFIIRKMFSTSSSVSLDNAMSPGFGIFLFVVLCRV